MELLHFLKRIGRDDPIVDHLLSLVYRMYELRILRSDIGLPAWIARMG